MTTSAEIRTALETSVFSRSSLLAITDNVLFYAMTEGSEKELSAIYSGQQINAFQVLVSRAISQMMTGAELHTFDVEISYFKAKDTEGQAWVDCLDALDTVIDEVRSQLGNTWNGLIDYWTLTTEAPAVEPRVIDSTEAWRSSVLLQCFATNAL